ncbi:MAG: carbon-nitrogen family hydrolase [Candidatus Thermoplasmatota archaeon]|jgi:predicted amidohydrolase|nr:carbon-nitrogen family hydrolase [Candidatus Thermoplasmatota archaeon]
MRPTSTMSADPLSGWKDPLEVIILQTAMQVGSPEANIERAGTLLDAALEGGRADLAVLPEAFATGFPFDDLSSLGPFHEHLRSAMEGLSRRHSIDIIYTQLESDRGALRNRCYHLDSRGNVEGSYDKTHLFSRSGEDRAIAAGGTLKLFRTAGPIIGPLICYELRFPELARDLTRAGASVLVYPAEWPEHRIFQWEHLLHARAIENQCFVIGVNTCGNHSGMRMGGRSMVVSPYGDDLCSLKADEGWARAKLEPNRMREVREMIPAYRELRRDLIGP